MAMTNEILRFVNFWENHGDEKSDTQKFWLDLLRNILSLEYPERFIEFEKRVALEHMSHIDAYIPSTRTIIEQKSFDVNLDKSIMQSDGTSITPFQQAKRYSDWLPDSQRARWIVICNFQEFRIYDMEKPKSMPEIISLQSLKTQWHKLSFLVDVNTTNIREVELSIKAGKLVGKLYDSLLKRYINPDDKESQRSLNVFCVRVVFLLYAEDAGLFKKNQFHNYLKARELVARNALRDLFTVLNQRPEERDPYLETDLKAFPYVNGGLFSGNDIELPQLDGEPLRIILEEMSEGFDWSGISPTIFGAVFESTLNPKTRHSGGMHYTSVDNIHRVINPLFLDGLNEEFDAIIKVPASRSRTQKLRAFQKKLGTLKFFDPACGSGNFLTESYLSLRRLENKILSLISKQISFADSQDETAIQVSISQFYGIEINDFAVSVARTALWIAEAQMWNETKNIILFYGDLLPLKSYNNIIEGNALRIDWNEVVNPKELNFIMGNPPFIGHQWRTSEQNEDMKIAFHDLKEHGKLDYVCSWYNKAVDFMKDSKVKAAFVSTNSICQGESVSILWKFLKEKGIDIFFAYRSFVWSSEAKDKAHVHCVIIGFSLTHSENKKIFDGEKIIEANNINGYLLNAPDIYMNNSGKTLNKDMPVMQKGSQPTDGGNLILTSDEREAILKKYPEAGKFILRYVGAREFIHNEIRYCLWLHNVNPEEYRNIAEIRERLKKVADFRRSSPTKSVQVAADTPAIFTQIRQPKSTYLVIPRHSSENRIYIPIGFMPPEIITSDACIIIPDISIYEFAILSSKIHMAWTGIVAGRLKSDIRYSQSVYNNFIWPSPNEKQKSKIESTAKKILDVRAQFSDSSLADLYDPLTMPEELLKAHKSNDATVCEAYGFDKKISEEEIVAELINMYNNIINIH